MILEAKNLYKSFNAGRVRAVEDVSLKIEKGKTLGILGESGSGKSTLAKLLLFLLEPDRGEICFEGDLRGFRRRVQAVFQEPYSSLDPRMKVKDILKEPFLIRGERDSKALDEKVEELLRRVELSPAFGAKISRQMSGGECQRIAIARAISTEPELVICDEPVSSLDVLVQVQILNLLLKLQKEKKISYLFISHDLRIIRHMSDEVLVMKDGRVCESGASEQIFRNPKHAYTQLLVRSLL